MLLSKSAIETWHFCRRKFRYAYIDQREPKDDTSTPEAIMGKEGHTFLESLHVGSPTHQPAGEMLRIVLGAYQRATDLVLFDAAEVNWSYAHYIGAFDGVVKTPASVDIWEHKFTTKDVTNDQFYWDKLSHDLQVGLYQLAARKLYGVPARIVYNVLRVPQYRQKQTEDRGEFLARVEAAITSSPYSYFFRSYLSWPDEDLAALEQDLAETTKEIDTATVYPKNRANCLAWRRQCEYYEACHNGLDIDDDTVYKIRSRGRTT